MSFRTRLLKIFKPPDVEEKPKPKTFALGGDPKKAIFGTSTGTSKQNLKAYEEAYKKEGIVHEAINNIAISAVVSGFEVKASTPVAQENLDMWLNKIDLSKYMLADMRDALIYGSSYKEKIYNLRGELVDLIMVNPRTMKTVTDKFNTVIYYEQSIGEEFGDKPKTLNLETIVQFGVDKISGTQDYVSAIGANYDMIMRMVRADEGISYYIDRHGFLKYLITCGLDGNPVSPDQFKKIKAEFEEITTKNEFLVDASVKVENLDKGSADIGDISDYFITKVTAGLGIPEERLGLGRGSTEATAKVRETAFEQKIRSYQRILAKSYELDVFKPRLESFGMFDVDVNFTFTDISPVDNRERAETVAALMKATPADPFAVITREEARSFLQLKYSEEYDKEYDPEEIDEETE